MNSSKKIIKILIWLTVFCASGTGIVLSSVYLYLSPNLPSVESIREVKLQTPLRVYSSDGKLIGEFGEKRRTPVRLEDVPPDFINALLAAEDANFYSHNGVSIKGLARAASQIITTGKKGSGGSTLTMQLTRHIFLTLNQTFTRKFNEILLALRIEEELSKEEILELYVNYMFLGKRAYGIHAAAYVYYGKSLDDLSLAQLAMIAGLFQGPSTQNPIVNPDRALERRNWILSRMYDLEMIDEEKYKTATDEKIAAEYHESKYDVNAPYVAELAREKAIRTFGLKAYTEGYRVYTTIDSKLQVAAQNAVAHGLVNYDERHGYRGSEGSLPAKTQPFLEIDDDTEEELIQEYFADWLDVLESTPDFGELTAGAVIATSTDSATVMLSDSRIVKLSLAEDISWARPYISENSRGPTPKDVNEVLNTGDLIRVRSVTTDKAQRWKLAQIPDAQSAFVALNPENGGMLALVGGFDFNHSNFNRATQAARQPGSNFKPFIYAAALESGMTAATIVNDAPVVFEDNLLENAWRPENDSGKFYGPTRLRKALYKSINLVSIRVLKSLGISNAVNSLERFGFDKEKMPRDLSLALGTLAATPVDIVTGYAAFANGGYKVNPHMIDRILDFNGHAIYNALPDTVCKTCDDQDSDSTGSELMANENRINISSGSELERYEIELLNDPFDFPFEIKSMLDLLDDEDYPKAKKIISDQVVFIIDSILQDVVRRGTGYKAKQLGRNDLAGKTGTTNGPTDVWFSGYNNNIVATAWVGFDQNTNLGRREFGSTAALPIWMEFMETALEGKPNTIRQQPSGIVSVRIDPDTGEQTRTDDPNAIFEYFRTEYVPEMAAERFDDDVRIIEDTVTEELF